LPGWTAGDAENVSVLISDPTENLLKESKGTSWGPLNTGVQKGKRIKGQSYLYYDHGTAI